LPARGQKKYRALDTIRAGTSDALNFNIWQGDITDQPSENDFVGLFKVTGQDLEDGRIIPAGTELVCDYEMRDSGNLMIEVCIPLIGMTFKTNRNFYSRQEGERNFATSAKFVRQEAEAVKRKLDDIRQMIDDPLLDEAERKVEGGERLDPNETASEATKQALDDVQRAKQLIAKVRKTNLKEFRQVQLADVVNDFEKVRQFASEKKKASFEALRRTAERNVGKPGLDFETNLSHLKSKVGTIYVRQPWFVIDMFNYLCANADLFADQALHKRLSAEGRKALEGKDIDALRGVLWKMKENQISTADDSEFFARANIARQG
jgi:molecular chaperone DnaK